MNYEPKLAVTIGGVTFKNPFYVASGPTVKSVRQLKRIEETGWAAASLKLSIDPAPYINRKPRYGLFSHLNALAFTAEKRLTFAEGLQIVEDAKKVLNDLILMVNITYAGDAGWDGWVNMAKQYESAGADIIELNMCCPNMSYNLEVSGESAETKQHTGASMGQHVDVSSEIVAAVTANINIPLFVKLTPEGGNIASVARALFAAGADAVGSTGNRLGMPPINLENPERSSYHLQDEISISCYSSAWLKPLSQRDTFEIRKANGPDPIITATGGIANWQDAVEMVMCGGNLLGICSETLINGYDIVRPMIQGMKTFMEERNYHSLDDYRGFLVSKVKTSAEVTLHSGYAHIIEPNLSAPCKAVCPHHVPVQAYVQKVAKGEFRDAFDLITAKNPLQSICGLVCSAPCEDACTLNKVSRPVAIRAIKRFVLEYGRAQGWQEGGITSDENGHKVAVIGSGPAGLTCAVTLRKAGYEVTIFEKEKQMGGNLRYGVPKFRLAQEELEAELIRVQSYGIEVRTEQELGVDFSLGSLTEDGFDGVFIAIGAHQNKSLGIDGENAVGVLQAGNFLKEISINLFHEISDKVVVYGKTISAIDAARSAIRIGASQVTLATSGFSTRRGTLQANLQEAKNEGVRLLDGVKLNEILVSEDKVTGVEWINDLGLIIQDKCETVILANPMHVNDGAGLSLSKDGFIVIDRKTGVTSRSGVYAGGDVVRSGNIISAIAAGKKGAVSIDRELRGELATLTYTEDTVTIDINQVLKRVGYLKDNSAPVKTVTKSGEERIGSFEPYERVLTLDEAVAEASRCLNCGCGEGCQLCKTICCEFAPDIIAPDMLGINSELCVACGMCYLRCPLGNIEMINTDYNDRKGVQNS